MASVQARHLRPDNHAGDEGPNGPRKRLMGVASKRTESLVVKRYAKNPAISEQLMAEVCGRENCKQALTTSQGEERKCWHGHG